MRSKILIFLVVSLFTTSIKNFAQVNVQDSLALVDFYNSTDGANWVTSQWDLNTPVSQWQGISLENNRVTAIKLWGAWRSGKILPSFGNLTALTSIEFLDCKLTEETLPESFSNLINLRYLKMSAVFWHLPFPTAITKLPNLTYVDLEDNLFTDTIPASLGNITGLQFLNLGNCFSIKGSMIPPELGNLKNLKNLILNSNNLSGTIPDSFANLDSLESLDLADNKLEGVIPSGLNNLKKLNSLFINNNKFTFNGIETLIQTANDVHKTYTYLIVSPQANIPVTRHHKTLAVSPGGTLANNTFSWYNLRKELIATIAGDSTYIPADRDTYYVTVTNSVVTDLILKSDTLNYNFFLADTTTTVNQHITGTDAIFINDDIFKIAGLKPVAGSNPLAGNVSTTVTIAPVVTEWNGRPYVQRHYDITPETNAENAQAIVTLYFTQQDFDNYNSYVTSNNLDYPLLPTGGIDNGNVRITQFHGSFTASPDPGNYDNNNEIIITPHVSWNIDNNWWEVTFLTDGFSGFFINTTNVVLPLTLIDLKAKVQAGNIVLQWTTNNEVNTKEFIIEESQNGTSFKNISAVKAASTSGMNNYSFIHSNPSEGVHFYRLKMMDIDGRYTYSKVVKAVFNNKDISLLVYPNPATSILNVRMNSGKKGNTMLRITDISGKEVYRKLIFVNTGINTNYINVQKLPAGIYYLNMDVNGKSGKKSFVKK